MPLLCWYDDITGRIIETASRMRESQKRHFQFTLRIWIDLFLKNKLPQHRPVDIHTPHPHKKEISEFFFLFQLLRLFTQQQREVHVVVKDDCFFSVVAWSNFNVPQQFTKFMNGGEALEEVSFSPSKRLKKLRRWLKWSGVTKLSRTAVGKWEARVHLCDCWDLWSTGQLNCQRMHLESVWGGGRQRLRAGRLCSPSNPPLEASPL